MDVLFNDTAKVSTESEVLASERSEHDFGAVRGPRGFRTEDRELPNVRAITVHHVDEGCDSVRGAGFKN